MGIEQNTHNPHFGRNNPVTTTQLLQIARLSSKRDYFRMARDSGGMMMGIFLTSSQMSACIGT